MHGLFWRASLPQLTHISSVPFCFLFGVGDSTLTFGERKLWGGGNVEGKEGFEAIRGFQYTEVNMKLKIPANQPQALGTMNEADKLIFHSWKSYTTPWLLFCTPSPPSLPFLPSLPHPLSLTELFMIVNAPQALMGPAGSPEILQFVLRI